MAPESAPLTDGLQYWPFYVIPVAWMLYKAASTGRRNDRKMNRAMSAWSQGKVPARVTQQIVNNAGRQNNSLLVFLIILYIPFAIMFFLDWFGISIGSFFQ